MDSRGKFFGPMLAKYSVMPGLDLGIHGVAAVTGLCQVRSIPAVAVPSAWIPGLSPGMTVLDKRGSANLPLRKQ